MNSRYEDEEDWATCAGCGEEYLVGTGTPCLHILNEKLAIALKALNRIADGEVVDFSTYIAVGPTANFDHLVIVASEALEEIKDYRYEEDDEAAD